MIALFVLSFTRLLFTKGHILYTQKKITQYKLKKKPTILLLIITNTDISSTMRQALFQLL